MCLDCVALTIQLQIDVAWSYIELFQIDSYVGLLQFAADLGAFDIEVRILNAICFN